MAVNTKARSGAKGASKAKPAEKAVKKAGGTVKVVKKAGGKPALDKLGYAIVFVTDMKRGVAFYKDVLGVPMKFDSPEWTEFDMHGVTLALHAAATAGSLGRFADAAIRKLPPPAGPPI